MTETTAEEQNTVTFVLSEQPPYREKMDWATIPEVMKITGLPMHEVEAWYLALDDLSFHPLEPRDQYQIGYLLQIGNHFGRLSEAIAVNIAMIEAVSRYDPPTEEYSKKHPYESRKYIRQAASSLAAEALRMLYWTLERGEDQ